MRVIIIGAMSEAVGSAIVGIVFVLLASLVAVANLSGTYQAIQLQRKGIQKGYSSVPLLSLMFSILALGALYRSIGYWPLLPAALDPGTWSVLVLPFYLVWRMISDRPL
jgi:hypothetical protein